MSEAASSGDTGTIRYDTDIDTREIQRLDAFVLEVLAQERLAAVAGSAPLWRYLTENAGDRNIRWRPNDLDVFVADRAICARVEQRYIDMVVTPLGLDVHRRERRGYQKSAEETESEDMELRSASVDETEDPMNDADVCMTDRRALREAIEIALEETYSHVLTRDQWDQARSTVLNIPETFESRPYKILQTVTLMVDSRSAHETKVLDLNVIVVQENSWSAKRLNS